MYNIHSHYENILSYAKSIIAQPTVAYLHPFGSTQPENLEIINNGGFGPALFCYDQEPLLENFNDKLFYQSWRIIDDLSNSKQVILLNTERSSTIKNKILEKFKKDVPYYLRRLVIRPGLTGWNQVHYRDYEETLEEITNRLKHDFYYIENMSLQLDVEIIIRTVIRVFRGQGQA